MIKKMIAAACISMWAAQSIAQVKPVQSFPLSDVRLLKSPFEQAQETDMKYILSLNPDRLLAPYLREAGLTPRAPSYGNWENTGLDGHIGGHYLSALSLMYASTGNPEIKKKLDYMLAELKRCQDHNGNGYVGGIPGGKAMWQEIEKGNINSNSFGLNNKWVPLYNIHKLYAGLYDAYSVAGNATAREMLIKLTDWFYNTTAKLTDEQVQTMLRSEHGGLNEVFANVYGITGNKKYLEMARRFSHQAILGPLEAHKDALTGIHANTQIPKVIGFERIAQLSGDTAYNSAAAFFWRTVVNHRTVAIGGNSVREHFNPTDNFSSMIESREGPETCNSYNMLKLTRDLFLTNPTSSYIDYYERTLYNHILSSQRPEGGFVYFTPMRPGHYRVYSNPQESFWCCVGSGLENHGKYGELIYAHQGNDLLVNLFIASELRWKEKGLTVTQQTTFPYSEQSALTVKLNKPSRFSMRFRYPSWVNAGQMQVKVNGQAQSLSKDALGYAAVSRTWKTGDKITVTLPMHNTSEVLPDGSNYVAFLHGPIVLAADMGKQDEVGLEADGSRMGHIASGPMLPLDEAPLLVSTANPMVNALAPEKQPLTYDADKLIYQDKYKNLKLVPFFTLQDTRYVLYWPFTTSEKLPALVSAMKAKEEKKQQLDLKTVDLVNTGEQQPETDHQFKGEKTENGSFQERHFRNGKGWFSYVLKNTAQNASKLRLTYFGREKDRNFDIYVNQQLVTSVKLDGTAGSQFTEIDYPLPQQVMNAKQMEVKFVAADQSAIANIYEVRLMKP